MCALKSECVFLKEGERRRSIILIAPNTACVSMGSGREHKAWKKGKIKGEYLNFNTYKRGRRTGLTESICVLRIFMARGGTYASFMFLLFPFTPFLSFTYAIQPDTHRLQERG
jgi:hypothetical protein